MITMSARSACLRLSRPQPCDWVPESIWGRNNSCIVSLDVAPDGRFRSHLVPVGRSWSECIAAVPEEHLRPAESENKDHAYVGA
jgi:hypothetical protein